MKSKSLKEQAERKFTSFEEWKKYDKIQKKTAPLEVVNTTNSQIRRPTETDDLPLNNKNKNCQN